MNEGFPPMSMLDSAFDQPGFRWNEVRARHLLNRAGESEYLVYF